MRAREGVSDMRIFTQDDLLGLTPAEIVDEIAAVRARAEVAEADRDRWKEIAEHPEAARAVPGRQMGDDRA